MRLSMDDIEFIKEALRIASITYTNQEDKDKFNTLMVKLGSPNRI
jgi:hypothetical protein